MEETRTIDVSAVIDNRPVSWFQTVTIVLCGLVATLDGFDTQAVAFVAPVIAKQWSIEVATFGQVFAAGLLGLTVGALVCGPVGDKYGRKYIIVLSVLIFGVFALLTASAMSFSDLLLYRFLTGIGLGGAMPNIIALTSEYAPARIRALLVTVMFCGFPCGAVLGGLLSAHLIPTYGWQIVFYLGGILPLLLVPFLLLILPESLRFLVSRGHDSVRISSIVGKIAPENGYTTQDRFILPEQALLGAPVVHLFSDSRSRGTLLLWIVFFSNLLLMYFLVNWLPTVLQQAGLPIERAILVSVLLNAGGVIGGIVLARAIDRRGPYGVLTLTYACAAVCVAGIGLVGHSLVIAIAAVLSAGFCIVGAQFGMNALAANYYPTAVRSTGVGWALGIGRIGSVVGPILGGLMIALAWNISTIFLVSAIPAVIATMGVFLMGKTVASASTPAENIPILRRTTGEGS